MLLLILVIFPLCIVINLIKIYSPHSDEANDVSLQAPTNCRLCWICTCNYVLCYIINLVLKGLEKRLKYT